MVKTVRHTPWSLKVVNLKLEIREQYPDSPTVGDKITLRSRTNQLWYPWSC